MEAYSVYFCVWLLSVTSILWYSSTLCELSVCSFLTLQSIPLYGQTTMYLSIQLSVDFWVVSSLGILCIMVLWTFLLMSFGIHLYVFIKFLQYVCRHIVTCDFHFMVVRECHKILDLPRRHRFWENNWDALVWSSCFCPWSICPTRIVPAVLCFVLGSAVAEVGGGRGLRILP